MTIFLETNSPLFLSMGQVKETKFLGDDFH